MKEKQEIGLDVGLFYSSTHPISIGVELTTRHEILESFRDETGLYLRYEKYLLRHFQLTASVPSPNLSHHEYT